MRRDQAFGVGLMHGNRFVDRDVQVLLGSLDARRGVLVVWGCNDEGVHFAGAKQLTNHDVLDLPRRGEQGENKPNSAQGRIPALGEFSLDDWRM